jgi:hypothetical protein
LVSSSLTALPTNIVPNNLTSRVTGIGSSWRIGANHRGWTPGNQLVINDRAPSEDFIAKESNDQRERLRKMVQPTDGGA